jgi:hypothetical protein
LSPWRGECGVVDHPNHPWKVADFVEASEDSDRQKLARTAFKIALLPLEAARDTVDGVATRQEVHRLQGIFEVHYNKCRELLDEALGGTLRNCFGRASGVSTERVQRPAEARRQSCDRDR